MDKFWSVAAMPIGVFLCFSPVIIAWIIAGLKANSQSDKRK
jgi:hypothetical protein